MNKKFKTFVGLCVLALLSTGCVKYNAKMDIKKDKSINYEIIYAIQASLSDSGQVMDEEGVKELKDNGYTVENYNENGYTGFKISKKIKNIDDVCDTNEVTFSLSDNVSKKDVKIFTVKKGLFKNTYKAKFSFDMDNSNLSIGNNEDEDEDNINLSNNNDEEDEDITSTDDNNMDMSQFTSSMDLKYTVNLPYKAKSNNATTVNNGGKQLEWNLGTNNTIEYEFELYNLPFYIVLGVGIVIIIATIIIVIKKKKGNNKAIIEITSTQPANTITEVNNIPTMNTSNQIINNVQTMDTSNQVMNNDTNVDNNNIM